MKATWGTLNFAVASNLPTDNLADCLDSLKSVIPSGFSETKSRYAQFLLLCHKKISMEAHIRRLNVLRETADHGPAGYIDRQFKSNYEGDCIPIENSQYPKCIDFSSWFSFHLYQCGIDLNMFREADQRAGPDDPRAHDLKIIINDMINKTRNSHIAIDRITTMIIGLPFERMVTNNAFGLRSLVSDLLVLYTGVTKKKFLEPWDYMDRIGRGTSSGYHRPRRYIDIPIVASSPVPKPIPAPIPIPIPTDLSECTQETKLIALNLVIANMIENMQSSFNIQRSFEEIKTGGLARYIVPAHPNCINLGAWFNEVLDYCELRGNDGANEHSELFRMYMEVCIEIMITKISESCVPIDSIRYLVISGELIDLLEGDHDQDPVIRKMIEDLINLFTSSEDMYDTLSGYLDARNP